MPPNDPRLAAELLEIKVATVFDHETEAARFDNETSPFRVAMKQYIELFTVRSLNRRMLIACLLQIIQQFTGIK